MAACHDMSKTIVVTGTDTDVGKTVFCAGLMRFFDGMYWKPVQAGLTGGSDSDVVRHLSQMPAERILPEAWRLRKPAYPHWAAEIDGVEIDPKELELPVVRRPLIVEGAGGLMVPLTRDVLQIDVFARWGIPVLLCARTQLGTINHTLLSIAALRRRAIPLLGVVLIGGMQPETVRAISMLGDVRVLGGLPHLQPLTPTTLHSAFATAFPPGSFVSTSDSP